MKKIILIFLVLILAVSPVFANNKFSDVDSEAWYSNWVGIITDFNITSGYPDGTFRPDNQLKRIELLSFTMKSLNYDLPVASGYWGQNIIDKALEIGIITDQSNDLMFTDPDGFITREETARVIYNAYLKESEIFTADVDQHVRTVITDFDLVDEMYIEGVVGVYSSGIVEGYSDKSFKPKNQLTRAEASVFITRLRLDEKRKKVELDMPYFEYETLSFKSKNFKEYYNPEHQDIYNIMTIVDTIENANTNNGFAWIGYLSPESTHSMSLYSNMEDFDFAPVTSHHNYKRWSIEVKKNPPNPEYLFDDWIEILGWRKADELKHEETLKAVFRYLFAEDADFLWNKYFELANDPNIGDKDIDYEMVSNGRTVRFHGDHIGMGISITRKTDAQPVNVEDVR
ncbi:MAG: S-layer homology domain-containing protein [Clostridiales bacterium]|nr:S-layer homology domain-containing protein [Clostridiales bacterium]